MADVTTQGPPFVGRAGQLAVLEAALDQARAGGTTAVFVEADAGVGKSRLAAELAQRAGVAGDVTVLLGHCASAGGEALPYLPFVEALTTLDLRADLWWSARPATAELSQVQLFDAVASELTTAARSRTVLLVLEDLHWADHATRELLTFLLRRVREERLLLVATVRTDDLHRRHPLRGVLAELGRLPWVRRVVVEPFTEAETGSFLRGLADDAVPPRTAAQIHSRAEGNAYYAGELLLAAGRGPAVGRGADLPEGLADLVLARVEALPPIVSEVVRAAAVGGRRVRHDLLRAASGMGEDDLEAALRDAVAHRVLDPDGEEGYAFRHALLHEAVYSDLLPGERVRRHAAYARAISEAAGTGTPLASAAELAHHARQSNDLAGALVAGLLAADEAERLRAPEQAWRHLEEALPLWDAVPGADGLTGTTVLAATARAASLAGTAGASARAVALARAAVARLDDDTPVLVAASAHRLLASQLWSADDYRSAMSTARRAADLARPLAEQDPAAAEVLVWALAIGARSTYALDLLDEARTGALAARELAERHAVPGAEADALITLANLDNLAGDLSDADALFAQADAAARAAGHLGTSLRARYNQAAERYDRGDLEGALRVLDEGTAWAADQGLTWAPYGLQLMVLQATACFVTGRFDRAETAARSIGPQVPSAAAAGTGVVAAQVAAATGRFDEVEALTDVGPGWLEDLEDGLAIASARAEALRWSGRPAEAADLLMTAVFSYDGIEHPAHLVGIRLAAQAVGALADVVPAGRGPEHADRVHRLQRRAAELARIGQPRAGAMGPEGRAWSAVVDAEAERFSGTDPSRAVQAWRAVVAAFSYGAVYEVARSRWRLGEALVLAGDRDAGFGELVAAEEVADRLGALPLRDRVRDLLRRTRGPVAAAGSGAAGPLTARESQVLALLAEGLTNREVGATLFMAEKTASVHVSRILAKLGAASRAEAVSIGLRRNLIPDRTQTGNS